MPILYEFKLFCNFINNAKDNILNIRSTKIIFQNIYLVFTEFSTSWKAGT